MSKPTKGKNNKINRTKCSPSKCIIKEHGDQICEAIRKPASNDDHSICYIIQLCDAFCSALDSDGRSAIHTAALVGKNKVIHYLATHGADVNIQDSLTLQTPLHYAILSGNIGTALILLKYGASTTIPDKNGITPANHIADQQPNKRVDPLKPPAVQGYSWGINANYNLGLASAHARETPEHFEVPLKKGDVLETASMNKFHSVFLSENGKVFVCGHGRGGRLGFETDSTVIIPHYVKVSNSKIIRISAGVDHTLFLNKNNEVLSCGMNKYHQLGFFPCPSDIFFPQILKQWHAKHPNIKIIGVAATAYHSVIWSEEEAFTFGLNAGQLGHTDIQNDTFVDLPRSINYIKNRDKSRVGYISNVVVSEGSTVVVTSLGNIIAFYEHKAHFLPLKLTNLKKIACSGGILDTNSNVAILSDHKNEDLKIAILSDSDLFVWSEKSSYHVQKDGLEVWETHGISDFCISSQNLCLVDKHGQVYYGHLDEEISVSSREKIFESNNYQYFYSKGLNCVKSIKKEEKIPYLYRTHSLFSDPKGNNFIAFQYDPRLFLKRRVSRIANTIRQDISNYYAKIIDINGYYDVEIVVGNRCFPAHSFILSYNSEVLHEKLVELFNQPDRFKSTDEAWKLRLDNIDADAFEEILNIIHFYNNHKGKFGESNRFVRVSSEKESDNWEVNFVHLQRKEDNEICESIKKSRFLRDSTKLKRPKKENINYPLKNIKELSCQLKLKDIQELLLITNSMDFQNEGVNHQSLLSDIYAPTMIFKRSMFPEFWDVSFKCEDGEVVKGHKFILMARSSYFDALLGFRWNQDQGTDMIDISIPSAILIPVMDFLYTNVSPIVSHSSDLDFLCKILIYSHQYLIKGLHKLCQRSIYKCLTLKNCFDLLKFCCVYDAVVLKEAILEFICINMSYYFDNRILRDLDDETIVAINKAYNKNFVLPLYENIVPRRKSFVTDSESEPSLGSKNDINNIPSNDELYCFSRATNVKNDITDDVLSFDEFYYIPKKITNVVMPTNIRTNSIPSLDDLEFARNYNSYIIHQTPEDWVEEFKDNCHVSSDLRELPSSERKRKSSNRKRTRKPSSSSQTSTGSNSESENNAHDLDDSLEPFSFEDLEDRMSKNSSRFDEWRVVGKNKQETDEAPDVESNFKNLHIKGLQEQTFTSKHSQSSSQISDEGFSVIEKAPFPTLSESLTMGAVTKEFSPQFKRLPKFQSKGIKKCKKSPSNHEEQKLPSPTSNAWGFGSPENCSLLDVMKKESNNAEGATPKSASLSNCSNIKTEQPIESILTESQQLKRRISEEEDICHWNPITHTVVESPRETNDVSFSSIVQEEVNYTKHLEFQRNKPLSFIQLEEKAIKEIYEFYGGEFNPEERIFVTRCGINPANPSWNIQYRHV